VSYRWTELSPQTSTNGLNLRMVVHGPWSASPEKFRDMQFLRSWLEFDSELDDTRPRARVNWNAVLGLMVVVGVSAGFWTGVGFLIANLV
jgi:hypothetical protein